MSFQVLLQGCAVTEDNLASRLDAIKLELQRFENQIASSMSELVEGDVYEVWNEVNKYKGYCSSSFEQKNAMGHRKNLPWKTTSKPVFKDHPILGNGLTFQ